jgi:hypothetical protein
MHHTLLSAQQDARDVVPASSSETIPFEPPVVHRGYGSHMETFRQEALRNQSRRSVSRDLLFRDEDRRTFKAVHPLLLTKPQVYPVHKDAEKE